MGEERGWDGKTSGSVPLGLNQSLRRNLVILPRAPADPEATAPTRWPPPAAALGRDGGQVFPGQAGHAGQVRNQGENSSELERNSEDRQKWCRVMSNADIQRQGFLGVFWEKLYSERNVNFPNFVYKQVTRHARWWCFISPVIQINVCLPLLAFLLILQARLHIQWNLHLFVILLLTLH